MVKKACAAFSKPSICLFSFLFCMRCLTEGLVIILNLSVRNVYKNDQEYLEDSKLGPTSPIRVL